MPGMGAVTPAVEENIVLTAGGGAAAVGDSRNGL